MRITLTIALLGAAVALSGCTKSSSRRGGASTVAPTTSATPSPTGSTTTGAVPSAAPSVPAIAATAPANLATGPRLVVDATSQSFFDLPYPFDARLDAQGHPDLSKLPNPRGEKFVDDAYKLASTDTDGFSPTGPIYFRFESAINAPPTDSAASLLPGSAVFLVDVDPTSPEYLKRTPARTKLTLKADTIRPAHMLQLLPEPGCNLRPKTTYAVVVLRALGAPNTQWLGQDPVTTDLLAGKEPLVPEGAKMARAMAPLVSALTALKLHPQDIAAATVFTTNDPTASLIQQVAWVQQSRPPATVKALEQRDVYPDFTALKGSISVPLYQDGWSPYLFVGGRQVVDAQGNPVAQGSAESKIQVSVPKGVMPRDGFPLYFFCHGTGGKASQAIDRGRFNAPNAIPPLGSGIASYVAPEGWGTSCMAGPFSPDRIGIMAADGYLAYNFLNPVAMRDNFIQMVLEQVHFLNWLVDQRIDPALCPGTDASASPDGKIRFDPAKIIVGGQSLGSYLAGMLAATVKGYKGVILTGAGGSWIEFPFGPKVPFDLQLVVELLGMPFGEKLDRFHPLILAFDLGVGPADNTHYHRYIQREPLPGHTPPHVLVIEGHEDLQVAVGLQRALTLAIGLDFVGPDPGPTADERILPVLPLRNLAEQPYPFGGNRTYPNGDVRTGVVVRYAEDGIREGHYVSFQLSEPKRQVREFLNDIEQGTTPIVRK
jgi:hypothetical protein